MLPGLFPSDPWNIQGWVVVEILALHLLTYGVLPLLVHKNTRSGKPDISLSRLSWIRFLNVMLLAGGLILFLSEGGVVNGKVFFKSPFPQFSGDLFGTVSMYATTFYLLLRSDSLKIPIKKYGKSSISPEFMKEKSATIRNAIEEGKLFTNPDFSLGSSGLKKQALASITFPKSLMKS